MAPRSSSPLTTAANLCSTMPYPSSLTIGEGRGSQEHTPRERTMEELIAFGGIADPVTASRRVSNRIQEQPDGDDMQLARAKKAAMLRVTPG